MRWLKNYYRPTHLRAGNKSAIAEYKRLLNDETVQLITVGCPNCRKHDDELLFDRDRYGIPWNTVICRNCGMIYSNPQMDADSTAYFYSSDLYRKIYGAGDLLQDSTDMFDLDVDRSSDYHRLTHYDFIKDTGIRYKTLVEIGAGGGWNLVPFINEGTICVGYDFSPVLVDAGRQAGINMIHADDQGLDGKFDLIMLKHVLEHLDDPIEQLVSLRNHLTTDGHLFIEVPGIVAKIPSIQNAHYHYFSERTLNSIVSQSGFEITNSRTIARNGNILALAKHSGINEKPEFNSSEFDWAMDIIHRGRRGMFKALIAQSMPNPIVKLIRAVIRR